MIKIKKTAKAQFWSDAHPPLFTTESTAQSNALSRSTIKIKVRYGKSCEFEGESPSGPWGQT